MAEDTEDKEELSMEDILSSIKDILMEDNAEQHKAGPERRAWLLRPQRRSRSRGFPAGCLPKPSMTF